MQAQSLRKDDNWWRVFHQRARGVWSSLSVMSAAVNAQGRDPLIYQGLQNAERLILPSLFHLLLGILL